VDRLRREVSVQLGGFAGFRDSVSVCF
jgi:hypothetical protein